MREIDWLITHHMICDIWPPSKLYSINDFLNDFEDIGWIAQKVVTS